MPVSTSTPSVDEQRVEAVLDQLRHGGVPQAGRVQRRVQAQLVAPVGEPVIDVVQAHAALPLARRRAEGPRLALPQRTLQTP